MIGYMTFYDEPSAWGLIVGDDERLYVVRGRHLVGPSPRVGEKVRFDPEDTGRGLQALAVRRVG
jgi:hypothetical protein